MKYQNSEPFAIPRPSKVMPGTCEACCFGTKYGAEHADDCRWVELLCPRCFIPPFLKFDKAAHPSTEVVCKVCRGKFRLRSPYPVTIEFTGVDEWDYREAKP